MKKRAGRRSTNGLPLCPIFLFGRLKLKWKYRYKRSLSSCPTAGPFPVLPFSLKERFGNYSRNVFGQLICFWPGDLFLASWYISG